MSDEKEIKQLREKLKVRDGQLADAEHYGAEMRKRIQRSEDHVAHLKGVIKELEAKA